MRDYIEQGDCLELMKNIPDKSVDMILCDLPYGTTACKWDTIIPFEPLWEQYNRVIKSNGAIALFGNQLFTAKLISNNIDMFRYSWIWDKVKPSGHLNSKKRPMNRYENISIFSKETIKYNPQGLIEGKFNNDRPSKMRRKEDTTYGNEKSFGSSKYRNYPQDVIVFSKPSDTKRLHPTQKPVELLEYLIKTYTNENETVLDNCMGSGSTCVACINTNRHYIGFELEQNYFDIAQKRIEDAKNKIKEDKRC